jgi:hypothetical protein
MVDQNVIETTMRIEADAAAAKKTEARVRKVISGLETLQKTQTDPAAIKITQEQIELYKKEGFEIVRNTELIEEQARVQAQQAKEQARVQAQQTKLLEKRVKERQRAGAEVAGEREFAETTKRVAALGDVESNINAIGGALGTVGGEAGRAAEQVLRVGAEFFASAEAAPRLVSSLKGAPAALKAAATTTLGLQTAREASAVAATAATGAEVAQTTATTALAPASVAAAGGISAMLVPLAPFVIAALAAGAAVAAVVSVFGSFTSSMNEGAEAARDRISAEDEFFNTVVNGSQATAEARLEELEAERQVLELRRESLQQLSDEANARLGIAGDIAGAFGTTEAEEYENALDDVDEQLSKNTTKTELFSQGLEDGAFKAEKAAKSNEDLSKTSEVAATKLEEVTQAEDELAQASEDLAKDLENASKNTANAKKSEAKAQADLTKAQTKAVSEVSKLRKEQSEELVDLNQEQSKELLKAQTDAHEEALKARDDFDKSIRDKVKNQSFLAAIDEQDSFSEEQSTSRIEQAKKITELRAGFDEERTERLEAQAEQRADAAESAQESLKSSREALAEASKLRRDAEREEMMLIKQSSQNRIELIRNQAQTETQLYQQIAQNFGQFVNAMQKQGADLLSDLSSGKVNGANGLGGISTKQLQGIIG